ncbi:sulfite reductase subunit alpha [Pseudomonas knackmussii]|uniref:NADPH--hemoprotein reductase n=1 Tax=Pseudomonas knackmussii TaxID=65741 RepID=A0ABY4KQW9_9PSED|nr:sulfite reductase subunit alpha [Pseudomonas knackmussii]UPQ82043.1 sulfite reductase subunit alpha [Pseudomonas knackmussii]
MPTPLATHLRHYPFPLACVLLAAALLHWQPPREVSAAVVVLGYLALCLLVWRPGRAKSVEATKSSDLLIAFASQGGQARELAERSARQLADAGVSSTTRTLNELDPATLTDARRLLFVVSTYGEGEAPDNAARFERRLLASHADLSGLQYTVLALGDSQYSHYCGFGRRLDDTLRSRGGEPLFDRLDVDRLDAGTLRHWQQQLGQLSGHNDFSDWQPVPYGNWRLAGRSVLNPGSSGAPVCHIRLEPLDEAAHWRAGDIADIGPRHPRGPIEELLRRLGHDPQQRIAGESLLDILCTRRVPAEEALRELDIDALLALPQLAHREYSIASVPADDALELLVREARQADGSLGLGSGWLCRHAPAGAPIALRIRSNPGFHGPAVATPLVLIGNGTGMAGLRAHLRERAATPGSRNWLLFGERNAAHDLFLAEELQQWLACGHLQRLDLAFSRDQTDKRYVPHALRDAGEELCKWVAEGAAIHVCGSLSGMGQAVQQILVGLLGEAQLNEMAAQGRYRRDLY